MPGMNPIGHGFYPGDHPSHGREQRPPGHHPRHFPPFAVIAVRWAAYRCLMRSHLPGAVFEDDTNRHPRPITPPRHAFNDEVGRQPIFADPDWQARTFWENGRSPARGLPCAAWSRTSPICPNRPTHTANSADACAVDRPYRCSATVRGGELPATPGQAPSSTASTRTPTSPSPARLDYFDLAAEDDGQLVRRLAGTRQQVFSASLSFSSGLAVYHRPKAAQSTMRIETGVGRPTSALWNRQRQGPWTPSCWRAGLVHRPGRLSRRMRRACRMSARRRIMNGTAEPVR